MSKRGYWTRRQVLQAAITAPAVFLKVPEMQGGNAMAAAPGRARDLSPWDEATARHPAGGILRHVFPVMDIAAQHPSVRTDRREDYLALMAGIVDFFHGYQDPAGAIIDPYVKAERQYATPAFALAAASLVRHAGRHDLLEPALLAQTFAVSALANGTTADFHADFYIPMIMHTRRLLKKLAGPASLAEWDAMLRSLVPEKAYRDHNAGGNWNIVNVSGECLRRKDGLVDPAQAAGQSAYIERSLTKQAARFTRFGMYEDPNAPLAYDAFPRLWMEDAVANEAYDGPHHDSLLRFLVDGGLSTLLLLSPSGEWPCGGRSAHHQWNEAE